MADAPNPADLFSWRMVDAIRYCADLATAAKGGPAAILRARDAASQMAALLPDRTLETLEAISSMPQGNGITLRLEIPEHEVGRIRALSTFTERALPPAPGKPIGYIGAAAVYVVKAGTIAG